MWTPRCMLGTDRCGVWRGTGKGVQIPGAQPSLHPQQWQLQLLSHCFFLPFFLWAGCAPSLGSGWLLHLSKSRKGWDGTGQPCSTSQPASRAKQSSRERSTLSKTERGKCRAVEGRRSGLSSLRCWRGKNVSLCLALLVAQLLQHRGRSISSCEALVQIPTRQ